MVQNTTYTDMLASNEYLCSEQILSCLTAQIFIGDAYNQWNSTTHTVDQINSAQSKIKINLILNRYLVISYAFASSQFQQALIYDLSLERWGKVKTPHVDVGLLPWAINSAAGSRPATIEELTDPIEDYVVPIGNFNVLTGEDTVELELLHWRDNIGFMSYDAAIKAMKVENSLQSVESGSGVLVFGHVQVTRGRKVTLQAIELDGLVDGNVYVLPSLSGYDRDTSQATTLTDSDGNYRQYRKRVTAENFDVAIEAGSFLCLLLLLRLQFMARVKIPYWTIPVPDAVVQAFDWIYEQFLRLLKIHCLR